MAATDFLTVLWVVSTCVTSSTVGVGMSPQAQCRILSVSSPRPQTVRR